LVHNATVQVHLLNVAPEVIKISGPPTRVIKPELPCPRISLRFGALRETTPESVAKA
jgi:hypothetical protein